MSRAALELPRKLRDTAFMDRTLNLSEACTIGGRPRPVQRMYSGLTNEKYLPIDDPSEAVQFAAPRYAPAHGAGRWRDFDEVELPSFRGDQRHDVRRVHGRGGRCQ